MRRKTPPNVADRGVLRAGETVVFLHVPKTAGTTLLQLIERNYRSRHIAYYYPPDKITAVAPGDRIDLFAGHLVHGQHASLGIERPRYFTFFRDPVHRIVSQYHYARRYHGGSHAGVVLDGRIRAYVQTAKIWFYDNCMTRMLAGVRREVAFGAVDEKLFERAIANLHRDFFFVGLQEHFARDRARLADLLGWRRKKRWRRLNASKYALAEVTSADMDYAHALSEYDRRLYDHVLENWSNP